MRRLRMAGPVASVPRKLAVGPRVDLWANPERIQRLEDAIEQRLPQKDIDDAWWLAMSSARCAHRDAVKDWAAQQNDPRAAAQLIHHWSPYFRPGEDPTEDVPTRRRRK